ncbi:MAG: tripartite tricarboxylate transporter substrate binding protein [Hyphomicrobiales bacterium]|nr:tripartite tricarboxylate transporter substrate binding protein [Hyphomicrobiales bacterium]
MRVVAALLGVLLVAWAASRPVAAQDFPRKQMDLVVPFVAGGTTDTIARLIAQRFFDSWGQTVVVTNRAGGGGTIGTNSVAKAAPDGHTLLVTTIGFAINAGLQKLPYDPINDFAPVAELASLPLMLVVHSSVPANTLAEFVALAKAKPGGWDYASAGIGTSPHLAAEMFKSMASIDLVHVPYKGNAEANNAMLGGHVKIYFALAPAVIQHVRAGTLRALAVTTERRLPYLPDVPTIAELGYPGYEISSWQGVFAPAGTPKEVVGKINAELVRLVNTAEVRSRMDVEGAVPVGSTPEAFATRVESEIAKWTRVIKDAGISPIN